MARILVVDDSSFQRQIVKNILVECGHETILAENGAIALQRLEEAPDVVLCDLVMPVIDGFEFLEALAQRKSTVPALVISADIQESSRTRCLELGAKGFLNKPVAADSLLDALAPLLAKDGQP